MSYLNLVRKLLEDSGSDEGDHIEITLGDTTFTGIVIPHHDFSGKDILTIKLENGFNIGLDVSKGARLKLISKGKMPSMDKRLEEGDPCLPLISFISTGGTIASFVDYRTGGVHPALTSKELIYSNPELSHHCDPRTKVLFSVLSENMTPQNWETLAIEVAKELNDGAKGVVIPHGTDTMGFTAAALSFLLKDLSGPVVLVGSQRSSDRPSSDAHLNLLGAVSVAKADLGEVVIAMHNGPSDEALAIHRGTKVRKMHSSRRDAFKSMNLEPIGFVKDDVVEFVAPRRKRGKGPVKVNGQLEHRVALLYFYPGMESKVLLHALKRMEGVVLAGTGLGHLSNTLIDVIKGIDVPKPIVMTTQCLEGTVDLEVYSGGRDLMKAGVISGLDMLPETAYVKLMWVLGRTRKYDEVCRLMTTDVAGEIVPRRLVGEDSDRGRS